MNKHLPWAAASAAAVLVLAGCASGGDDPQDGGESQQPSADASTNASGDGFGAPEDIAILEGLTWTEDAEGNPTLEFESPSSVSAVATLVKDPGEGDPVAAGQLVALDYTMVNGSDGSVLYSTYTAGAPEAILLQEDTFDPELWNALLSTGEGGELIYASVNPEATSADESTTYMAMTVTEVVAPLDEVAGAEVEPEAGVPTITFGEDGIPAVSFEGAEKPDELVIQPLVEGEGAVVEETDTVLAHYTGWVWDGEQFDSSWDRGAPTSFSLQGVIPGWTQGLAGQTVGSRVLLVIPPDLGYGEAGQGESIPGDSTLVFVVDILGAI
ncbi:FKBP-type peptidyl-prolyl cis-trans isomerase [Demequina sp. NBRC 110053]|uniref:FKBP-type peptidyl-prolyl cis-trans isomerase n=1 Tax=Demequina sp. NBRC 110053 TaxID=1570342 RepID=UPI000A009E00|nr:FKBP-type peptidyl-prolyl cis-trans isomerase [Demequina sp. NBRC 110053]